MTLLDDIQEEIKRFKEYTHGNPNTIFMSRKFYGDLMQECVYPLRRNELITTVFGMSIEVINDCEGFILDELTKE
jgi:dihydrofolate reductase